MEDYRKTKVDQFVTRVPKGKKADLQAHAAARDESLNGFVNRAIDETIQRDNVNDDTVVLDKEAYETLIDLGKMGKQYIDLITTENERDLLHNTDDDKVEEI